MDCPSCPTGPPGPIGPIGIQGTTGPTGPTGPTGLSQWFTDTISGYTGIGYTGDVIVRGNLYVEGGIDPTYLALTQQGSDPLPSGLDGIWIETGGSLRVQKTRLDDFSGAIAGYIDINPITNPQITLSDGGLTEINVVTLNNNTIMLNDYSGTGTTTSFTTTNLSQTTTGPTTITATWEDIINNTNAGTPNLQQVLTSGNLTDLTATFQDDLSTPLSNLTISNTAITHSSIGDLAISSNQNLTISTDNLTLSPNVLTVLGSGALPQEGVEIFKNNITISDVSSTGYTSDPCLRLINRNAIAGNTGGVPSIETYKNGRNANVNDVVFSQQFNAKDYNGNKKTFGKIECSVTNNSATNNIDGALDFYSCVDGNNNIVFRMNGADNENNCFRPLDMAGGGALNNIKTSNGNLSITTATSSLAGAVLTLDTKDNVAGSGAGLALTGNTLLTNTAGLFSSNYLALTIGGTVYKIALLDA